MRGGCKHRRACREVFFLLANPAILQSILTVNIWYMFETKSRLHRIVPRL